MISSVHLALDALVALVRVCNVRQLGLEVLGSTLASNVEAEKLGFVVEDLGWQHNLLDV